MQDEFRLQQERERRARDRLLAVAASLGLRAEIRLVPMEPAPVEPAP